MRLSSRQLIAIALTVVGCSSTTANGLNGAGGTSDTPDLTDQRNRHPRAGASSVSSAGGPSAGSGGATSGEQAGASGQVTGGSASGGTGSSGDASGASSGGANGTAGASSGSGAGGKTSGGGGAGAGTGGKTSGGGGAGAGTGGKASGGGGNTGTAGKGNGGGGVGGGGAGPTAGAPSAGGQGGGTQQSTSLGVGSNSLSFTFTYSGSTKLNSKAIDTNAGSTLLAVVAMGALANVHAPTDSLGDTFSQLLPKHNYQNWSGSGQQLFAATNIKGGKGTIVTETMPEPNDEVTLSVVEIRGAKRIAAATVAETANKGPITSATVTTTGPAVLVSWWWGDGAITQTSATTSDGWTRLHSLSRTQAESGVIQTELATKSVSGAGTYSVTWSSSPDQGAVVYLVAVE